MNDALRPIDARRAYERWHSEVYAEDARADRPWHVLLFRHLRPADLDAKVVLEIGCGRGELAHAIQRGEHQPVNYLAADFAEAAVRLGRRRLGRDAPVRWTVADIQRIPLADASVDTILSCETVEHLPDPARALRELHRVLRPGGRLLLTTPNYLGPFGLYRAYLRVTGRRFTEGGQPISRFMLLPLTRRWVRHAGFSILTTATRGHYALWPGRVPWEPAALAAQPRWLSPFGLHSIVVAEKR